MSTNSRDEIVLEVQYLQTPAPSVQVLDPANQTRRLPAELDDICSYSYTSRSPVGGARALPAMRYRLRYVPLGDGPGLLLLREAKRGGVTTPSRRSFPTSIAGGLTHCEASYAQKTESHGATASYVAGGDQRWRVYASSLQLLLSNSWQQLALVS